MIFRTRLYLAEVIYAGILVLGIVGCIIDIVRSV